MFRASITPNTMISQLSESRLLSSSLRIRSTRSTRGNVGVILHRLESKKIQKEGVWKANAASRHQGRKAATLTSAARRTSVSPTSLGDPHSDKGLQRKGERSIAYCMQTSLKWYSTIAVLSGTLAPAGTFLKNTDKICAADQQQHGEKCPAESAVQHVLKMNMPALETKYLAVLRSSQKSAWHSVVQL